MANGEEKEDDLQFSLPYEWPSLEFPRTKSKKGRHLPAKSSEGRHVPAKPSEGHNTGVTDFLAMIKEIERVVSESRVYKEAMESVVFEPIYITL